MNRNEIKWLDGNGSEGQFVLELQFISGVNYLKSKTYEQAVQRYDLFWKINPEIVGMTLYDASNQVIASKSRMAVAA
jgi:hypothetical protein